MISILYLPSPFTYIWGGMGAGVVIAVVVGWGMGAEIGVGF